MHMVSKVGDCTAWLALCCVHRLADEGIPPDVTIKSSIFIERACCACKRFQGCEAW
jgi:hypothetical protein